MKASKSRREIVEEYDRFDRRLTLVTFDASGKRVTTYRNYGYFEALKMAYDRHTRGMTCRLFLDIPSNLIPNRLEDVPVAHIWNPNIY